MTYAFVLLTVFILYLPIRSRTIAPGSVIVCTATAARTGTLRVVYTQNIELWLAERVWCTPFGPPSYLFANTTVRIGVYTAPKYITKAIRHLLHWSFSYFLHKTCIWSSDTKQFLDPYTHMDKQYFSRFKGRTKCEPKLKQTLLKARKPERRKPD